MKLQVQVQDDTFDTYQAEAGRRRKAPSALMAEVLERFAHTTQGERYLLLPPEIIAKLEQITGRHLTTPEQLLDAVGLAASISIGDIRVEATPAQLNELSQRAKLLGRPVEDLVRENYQQMAKFFFNVGELAGSRGW